ncbi:hypothetical protein QO200_16500 [Flavobacterium sp. Arc3]|jgi:hypothetical protein|uniref:hypothetical protein n=1 Tax=unclassified Flavobacterium TaxID=196869 RepID=UPI00352F08ED
MKILKIILLSSCALLLNSCASSFHPINPPSLNYLSKNTNSGVTFEYKYNLLEKKYAKKEHKKNVKLVAIKITNNTENDLVFGRDITLTYDDNTMLSIMEKETVYRMLKQSPTSYLWYLLLAPVQFMKTETNSYGYSETKSSFPIGLILGPGLAGGNMIAASSANKKFNTDLNDYNINGKTIKKGETTYGLIGVNSTNFDSIKIKM